MAGGMIVGSRPLKGREEAAASEPRRRSPEGFGDQVDHPSRWESEDSTIGACLWDGATPLRLGHRHRSVTPRIFASVPCRAVRRKPVKAPYTVSAPPLRSPHSGQKFPRTNHPPCLSPRSDTSESTLGSRCPVPFGDKNTSCSSDACGSPAPSLH